MAHIDSQTFFNYLYLDEAEWCALWISTEQLLNSLASLWRRIIIFMQRVLDKNSLPATIPPQASVYTQHLVLSDGHVFCHLFNFCDLMVTVVSTWLCRLFVRYRIWEMRYMMLRTIQYDECDMWCLYLYTFLYFNQYTHVFAIETTSLCSSNDFIFKLI